MIEANRVTKSYGLGGSKTDVLKGIDLQISDGDFTVILGASGSGKSTLLNCLSGLERMDGGSIEYDGLNIAELSDKALTKFRKDNIGFIFQQYYLLPDMTVDKNVRMGADLAGNSDYREIIKAVGLETKAAKYPSELSGGEQQRVSVARALAKKPKVLFLRSCPTFKGFYQNYGSLQKNMAVLMNGHQDHHVFACAPHIRNTSAYQ